LDEGFDPAWAPADGLRSAEKQSDHRPGLDFFVSSTLFSFCRRAFSYYHKYSPSTPWFQNLSFSARAGFSSRDMPAYISTRLG
jgi:hypothetical protein